MGDIGWLHFADPPLAHRGGGEPRDLRCLRFLVVERQFYVRREFRVDVAAGVTLADPISLPLTKAALSIFLQFWVISCSKVAAERCSNSNVPPAARSHGRLIPAVELPDRFQTTASNISCTT